MPIHPSHHSEWRTARFALIALSVVIILLVWLPWFSAFGAGIANYVPLHIVLELAAISVALMIVSINHSRMDNIAAPHTSSLAPVFLGVAILDTLHLLSFQGMPDFITPADPEKAINFWLAARYLAASGLLLSALAVYQRGIKLPRGWLYILVLTFTLVSSLWFLLWPATVPRTFMPGSGLTALKIALEYGLIAVYLAAALLFVNALRQPRRFHAAGMFAAALLMAMSEFMFTLYADVTDLYNLLGHILKIVSYAFLYRALFMEVVQLPYRRLQESEQRLRQQQEELDYFFDANLDLFCIGSHDGRFMRVNGSWQKVMGYHAEQLEGHFLTDFIPPAEQQQVQRFVSRVASGQATETICAGMRRADGDIRQLEWRAASRHGVVYASARDITAQLHSEARIRLLSSVVDQSPYPVIITDLAGHIEYVNDAFTRVSGYSVEDVQGKDPGIIKSGKTPASTYKGMWQSLHQGRAWQGELVNRNKAGQEYVEKALIYPLRDEQGQVINYIAHKEDITARREAERRIEQLSHYDQLTGLPNPHLLKQRFGEYQAAEQRPAPLALIWLDLDHFKTINDTLGHRMGDLVLREIGMRLRTILTGKDILGRHSGDGFLFVLPAADDSKAGQVAADLLQLIQQPLLLLQDNQELTLTASVGIALYPTDGQDFETLLTSAETAMYRAKQEGRNSYRFYAPEMQANSLRKLELGSALAGAQQREELWLAFQPQLDLRRQRMIAAEVLLRWNSPKWGQVSPAEFIPLAETNGLIVGIGEWVLQQAARQLQQWRNDGLPVFRLAINLSALQFIQPDFAAHAAALVQAEGLTPADFELELTEAVALNNPDDAQRIMAELKAAGFYLSIDDFGTGYSSMSYLKRFQVDELKIDQSFVRELGHNDTDKGIVTAIIQLAHSLNMQVVAEGVEEAEQLAFLQQQGCDLIQGYYYSKPLAAGQLADFCRLRGGN
ncbi:EAL domain-containing protein [Venatoribacter cucullus]|uniref:cyclic-guanylate-specific phosphodiesterase n=1 Tax=Venatoribacter cucullus TaxID=2661630 RepID=A0A9X7UYM3_9GAMM|nr:EAL domain-containing protein [Venatoribacter cucullus]QQD25355.1 EAL domain-containing protein [Venatoribacter cucullus]